MTHFEAKKCQWIFKKWQSVQSSCYKLKLWQFTKRQLTKLRTLYVRIINKTTTPLLLQIQYRLMSIFILCFILYWRSSGIFHHNTKQYYLISPPTSESQEFPWQSWGGSVWVSCKALQKVKAKTRLIVSGLDVESRKWRIVSIPSVLSCLFDARTEDFHFW